MAERWRRGALVIASTLLTLLLLEAGVRLWIKLVTPTLYVLDDELGWTHRPNAERMEESEGSRVLVRINSFGLRGPMHVGPSARYRVLVLGDSFAEGRQVSDDDLFSVVLEREHPELEVVNTSVMGYGTVQEALMLQKFEPLVLPKTVVLMVFHNDLRDNVTPFGPWIGPRPYADPSAAFHSVDWRPFLPFLPPIPAPAWLYRRSMLVELWQRRRLDKLRHTQLINAYIEHWWDMPEEIKWRVLERWVAALAQGRDLLLVACPERVDVQSGNREITGRLDAIAKRHMVRFVNLQDVLSTEEFLEIHWNAHGHKVVAETLASVLTGSDQSDAASARVPAARTMLRMPAVRTQEPPEALAAAVLPAEHGGCLRRVGADIRQ
jgi:lysophospholipase L1-like esterase